MHLVVYPSLQTQTTKLVVWGKLPECLVVYPPSPDGSLG